MCTQHTILYVSEACNIRTRVEEWVVSRIDDTKKNLLFVNVVGWGSRMNEEEAFEHLTSHLDNLLLSSSLTSSSLVLLWHGDWLQKGSITKAIAMYKDVHPDTLLVAVRGPPNDEHHAKFFASWKDYDVLLVEVPEEQRDKAMEKVVRYCPHLANPKNIKMGAMVHEHARCDSVLAMGGGETTYGEVQVCHAFLNPAHGLDKVTTCPPWTMIRIGRKKKEGSDEEEFPNPYMEELCEHLKKE